MPCGIRWTDNWGEECGRKPDFKNQSRAVWYCRNSSIPHLFLLLRNWPQPQQATFCDIEEGLPYGVAKRSRIDGCVGRKDSCKKLSPLASLLYILPASKDQLAIGVNDWQRQFTSSTTCLIPLQLKANLSNTTPKQHAYSNTELTPGLSSSFCVFSRWGLGAKKSF